MKIIGKLEREEFEELNKQIPHRWEQYIILQK